MLAKNGVKCLTHTSKRCLEIFLLILFISTQALALGGIGGSRSAKARNNNGVQAINAYICANLDCESSNVKIVEKCAAKAHMEHGICQCDDGYLGDGVNCREQTCPAGQKSNSDNSACINCEAGEACPTCTDSILPNGDGNGHCVCTGISCTNDSDCTNGFCYYSQCIEGNDSNCQSSYYTTSRWNGTNCIDVGWEGDCPVGTLWSCASRACQTASNFACVDKFESYSYKWDGIKCVACPNGKCCESGQLYYMQNSSVSCVTGSDEICQDTYGSNYKFIDDDCVSCLDGSTTCCPDGQYWYNSDCHNLDSNYCRILHESNSYMWNGMECVTCSGKACCTSNELYQGGQCIEYSDFRCQEDHMSSKWALRNNECVDCTSAECCEEGEFYYGYCRTASDTECQSVFNSSNYKFIDGDCISCLDGSTDCCPDGQYWYNSDCQNFDTNYCRLMHESYSYTWDGVECISCSGKACCESNELYKNGECIDYTDFDCQNEHTSLDWALRSNECVDCASVDCCEATKTWQNGSCQ